MLFEKNNNIAHWLLFMVCASAVHAAVVHSRKKAHINTSLKYCDLKLRLPQEFVDDCSDSIAVFYASPLVFRPIPKVKTEALFTQRLAEYHDIPWTPILDYDTADRLITDAFLETQVQYFNIPNYPKIMKAVYLPVFIDIAEQQLTRYCVCKLHNMTFTFFCPPQATVIEEQQLYTEIMTAIQAVLFISRMSERRDWKLEFSILMNNAPKTYDPCYTAPVGSPLFINSGGLMTPDHVTIYRREELTKVMCHELVHALKLDCYTQSTAMAFMMQSSVLNVQGKFNPCEAVTETIARLMYTVYMATQSQSDVLNSMLQCQLHYAMKQASLILHLNGFKCTSELHYKQIVQSTYAIEYHVLTAALLFQICLDPSLAAMVLCRFTSFRKHNDIQMAYVLTQTMIDSLQDGSGFRAELDELLGRYSDDCCGSVSLRMNAF